MDLLVWLRPLVEIGAVLGAAVWGVSKISTTTAVLSNSIQSLNDGIARLDTQLGDMRVEFKQLCERIHLHDIRLTTLETLRRKHGE